MKRRLGPLALLATLGSACGEPRLLEGYTEGQTRLRLVPTEFVGSVPCRKGVAGALQSYVAVVQQVTVNYPADAGYDTAYSTGPVPCDQAVMFPAVAGRLYGAEVYGFDHDVTADEATPAAARWSALCGRGRSVYEPTDGGLDPYRPTLSQRGFTVPLRGCTSFLGDSADAPTRLLVDTASALGSMRCGAGPDEVFALRGTLGAETRTALCEDPLVFDVPAADRYYTIDLIGLAADGDAGVSDAGTTEPGGGPAPGVGPLLDGGPGDAGLVDLDASVGSGAADAGSAPPPDGIPRWQTRCVGEALAGAMAPAVCDPLRALP
ncbi:MAG TPA: hypothetical protein VNN80_06990 [Polyangiaceae bacterium]|nr:hypothetical protein [Polyangiaceae bacterium]